MENRSVTFGLTGIGVLVAVVALALKPNVPLPVAAAVQAPAIAVDTASPVPYATQLDAIRGYDAGRELLGDFLGSSWDDLTEGRRASNAKIPLRVLFASLPDPFDSHLDWSYDADIEALRRAFGSAGYVPHSFWLPSSGDSVHIRDGAGVERVPAHDMRPGVFLFRRADPLDVSLYLLYLIPEIPTAGIHMKAFQAALWERAAILDSAKSVFAIDRRERSELAIAGPVYSGSAQSLRILLDVWLPTIDAATKTTRMVSGSATSFSNLRALTDSSCTIVPRRDAPGDVRVARLRFSATVHADEAMDAVLDRVMHALGVRTEQIAVLSEAGTQYGAAPPDLAAQPRADSVDHALTSRSPVYGVTSGSPTARADFETAPSAARRSRASLTSIRSRGNDAAVAGCPNLGDESDDIAQQREAIARQLSPPRKYLTVPFPINIASLRSEFERAPSRSAATELPSLADAPRTRLSLEDASHPREAPAVISRLTVPALDMVLSSIVHTLSEHDVRVVVIKATDVRDKLMLAREIRRGVRDVTIVMYESNVLLRRPEYSDALRGTLVLTTYPLALENQFWTTAHRGPAGSVATVQDLLTFPSDAALGLYNATLELVGEATRRVEFGLHGSLAQQTQIGGAAEDPEHGTTRLARPPVWVTVVGRDVFYPLSATMPLDLRHADYLSAPGAARAGGGAPSRSRTHEHGEASEDPSLSIVVVAPMLLIVALLAFFVMGREGMGRWWVHYPKALERPASPAQAVYLSLFVASLVSTYLPLAIAIDGRRIIGSVDPFTLGPSMAMWCVLGVSVVALGVAGIYLGAGLIGTLRGVTSRNTTAVEARRPNVAAPVLPPESPSGPNAPGVPRYRISTRVRDYFGPMMSAPHPFGDAEEIPDAEAAEQYRHETLARERTSVAIGALFVIIAFCGMYVVWSLRHAWHLLSFSYGGGAEATFTIFRALHLTSGVSPVPPLVLLGASFAIWTWWQLQQRREFDAPVAFENGLRTLVRAKGAPTLWLRAFRAVVDARRGLSWLLPGFAVIWIVLGVATVAWYAWERYVPTLELIAGTFGDGHASSFDRALWVGIISLLTSSSWAVFRAVFTWHSVERFLDVLSGTPLLNALARLPHDVARVSNVGFLGSRREGEGSVEEGRLLDELWERARADVDAMPGRYLTSDPRASVGAAVAQAMSGITRATDQHSSRLRYALKALAESWAAAHSRPNPSGDAPIEEGTLDATVRRAVRSTEEYVAMETLLYVDQNIANLRRLCFFLFASLLMLVTVNSQYPYEPRSIVVFASLVILVSSVLAIFFVMVGMSRNVTLSRIARTEPGKVTWDTTFVLNLLTFGVIPLVVLASAELPQVRAFLFSWADPIVRAIART